MKQPNLSATAACSICHALITIRATVEEIAAGATEEHVITALAKQIGKHLLSHSMEHDASGQPIIENGRPKILPIGPHMQLGELMQSLADVFGLRHAESIDPRIKAYRIETEELLRRWLDTSQSAILDAAGHSIPLDKPKPGPV